MDKILGLKNEEIKVGVAGDQSGYQQQQSSTLSTEAAPDKGHEKKGPSGVRGDDEKERQRQQGGETETSRSIPPFTEGYGTTGSHEGAEEEKQHGFGNAV